MKEDIVGSGTRRSAFLGTVENTQDAKAPITAADILNRLLQEPLCAARGDELITFYLQFKPNAAECLSRLPTPPVAAARHPW